ncbi:S-layer homology domain-containing protein [Microbacteriaceae bacterium VKM Ac-2855]|nr:S-layer homology domain-containing protein [Microbacteriaceae bacterium VKM Ac-2855]
MPRSSLRPRLAAVALAFGLLGAGAVAAPASAVAPASSPADVVPRADQPGTPADAAPETTSQVPPSATTGTLRGTVSIEGGGELSDRVSVEAIDVKTGYSFIETTDLQGAYSLTLNASTYAVAFRPWTSVPLASEWWDDKKTRDSANPVTITAGTTVVADAELDSGGSISGRVTCAGAPVVNGSVTAAPISGGGYNRSVFTDQDGRYTVVGLQEGGYELSFSNSGSCVGEWWKDSSSRAGSTPVTIGSKQNRTGIDADLQVGGAISGSIVGGAAAGGTVYAYTAGANPLASSAVGSAVVTAGSSDYTISPLRPGSYYVYFSPNSNAVQRQWYSSAATSATATAVSVTSGNTRSGTNFSALATVSISGRVVDTAGAPVPYTTVTATVADAPTNEGVYYGSVDTNGNYSIPGLVNGTYTVGFRNYSTSTSWASQWYENSPTSSGAKPIVVGANGASSIDATLQRGGSLSGTVTAVDAQGQQTATLAEDVIAVPYTSSGSGWMAMRDYASSVSSSSGAYQIIGLAAGSYRVGFEGASTSGSSYYGAAYYGDASSVLTARDVAVTAGADQAGVDATIAPKGFQPSFSDVTYSNPFFSDIEWMSRSGISTGYVNPDGSRSYRPTAVVSRQAMASFLYEYSGDTFTPPPTPSFSDVPVSHPFYTAIEWMKAEGISTGNADGTYRPNDAVSRQAMSAFLARMSGETIPVPVSGSFSDVPPSNPFFAQIEWMKTEGISTGYPDGTFRPLDSVTRQAMAAFLHRYDLRE